MFFKLKELMKKWWQVEDDYLLEKKFNNVIFGLGQSENDEMYMEEYRQVTNDYGNTTGKPINTNNLNKSSPVGDFMSTTPSTISTCSSINSLNGLSQQSSNPMIMNQQHQHYLMMQQNIQSAYEEDYNHYYRANLPNHYHSNQL